jgi:hypothetical protein
MNISEKETSAVMAVSLTTGGSWDFISSPQDALRKYIVTRNRADRIFCIL